MAHPTASGLRIASLETVRAAEHPNLIWVRVTADDGTVGLGETFFGAGAVEADLHDRVWPLVAGRDPLAVDAAARNLVGYLGHRSTGVEARANSAVDIALWDLWGKALGQPVAQLLGGFTRTDIRTYNTCAGTSYMREDGGQRTANYGLGQGGGLDDLDAFLHRADDLSEELLSEGITAMKIWPFDAAAEKSGGWDISAADLRAALAPFEKIRARVGDRMDVMVEFHSMWQLTPAIRIARALEPFDTYWHEDPIRMDSLSSLRRYAAASRAPVCASETLGTRWAFRDLLETDAAGIVMLDLSWCGGLSEARKIAAMAEAWHLPVAPHDCTGPVVLAASTHLSLNAPNALIQESVRAYLRTWYGDLVTRLPPVTEGRITVPPGPGLGLDLHPDLDRRRTVTRRVSRAE
ncbi:mandelate racemase/muconate lactonizing enzyme family protein [Jannaschia sp. LMIT008]|uniref:mandelate racemase/muconate lactonizing enzyme family protein n=1 Tax=Jannaschia maritima TaxID=3032585 RepID=UPI00281178F9|nr:mandelate racemase/muconate lactonizing enzyme family protein [Jannaschia sp. LMIT008]